MRRRPGMSPWSTPESVIEPKDWFESIQGCERLKI